MHESDFLNDKFRPAALPEVCAPRRTLLERFDQAAERRLIYVCAPAGYGKTVSTLLWLAQAGRKAVWIGLDAYDNGLSVFYKLLATGIFSTQPDNESMARILRAPAFSASPVEHSVAMLSEFLPEERRFALVLDDMHLITNEEILRSLPIVRGRLPHSFVVLVLTRKAPDERILEMERSGRAAIITPEQLRFTKEETQDFFHSMGRFLTPDELSGAHLYTDGWPMGVNAIAQSGLVGQSQGGQALEYYIQKQIWDSWDPPLRDFCLRTSVLNEMPVELVRRLTGREDSQELLDRLCAENAFVSHLGGGTYRYHHLFQDFLRAQRRRRMPQAEPELFKICARYYSEEQNHLLSLRYWLKSGDYKGIGPYFYSYVFDESNRVMTENIEYFASFFEGFPEEAFREYPALLISRVWYSYVIGDHKGMGKYLDALYKSIPIISLKTPEYMEYVALAHSVDHRQNFVTQIKRFGWLGKFIKSFSGGKVTRSIVSFAHNLPYMHRSNRDYCDMAPVWDDIVDKLETSFGRVLGTEWVYVRPGVPAGFAYERCETERALALALESDRLFDPEINSVEGLFCVKIMLHSANLDAGRVRETAAALRELEELVDEEKYFIPNFEAYKTRFRLWDGDKNAARTWLENYYVTQGPQIELYKVFQHFVTARAYMVLGDIDNARAQIDRLRAFGVNYRRPLDKAEAMVLSAALDWAMGEKKQAADTLEAALLDMRPYGFIRVFAQEGGAIMPVLKRVAATVAREEYRGKLTSGYVNEVVLATHTAAKKRRGVTCNLNAPDESVVKLSKQQLHMIELLSQGYRPVRIAEITGLKMPTVKTHLSLAYEKLGVNNSMDAVLRARELGLVEK